MNIQEIMQSGSNVSFNVNAHELRAFADYLIRSTKEEFEDINAAKSVEEYITPNDVCKKLRVTRPTLWRWANNGYLVPVEIGGKRLYKKSEIDIILQK